MQLHKFYRYLILVLAQTNNTGIGMILDTDTDGPTTLFTYRSFSEGAFGIEKSSV